MYGETYVSHHLKAADPIRATVRSDVGPREYAELDLSNRLTVFAEMPELVRIRDVVNTALAGFTEQPAEGVAA